MLCSNCGHKNPATNRFCGMCGTPLPQKPITTPGAQSTLSFTRLPVEVPLPKSSTLPSRSKPAAKKEASPGSDGRRSGAAGSSTAAAPAAPASIQERQLSSCPAEESYFTQAEEAESLEQFIAGFHYKPPTEEDELTMTADKPVLDAGTHVQMPAPAGLPEEPAPIADAPAPAKEEVPAEVPYDKNPQTQPPPFATKNAPTQIPERSHFLDLGEPAAPEAAAELAPSIAGPSFLGLSDAPVFAREDIAETAPRSHWRVWVAALVILIFVGLGWLEWRAEKNQSGTSPMGIMKMQIERLKGKKGAVVTSTSTSGNATEAAPASAQPQPSGSGPDMQVLPGQKPQPTTPDTGNKPAGTPEKPANPGTSSTAPGTQKQTRSGDETSAAPRNPQAETTPGGGAEAATTVAEAPAKETQNPKSAPGADELAKAQNASDSAAASAWLWKSVAKGNPEAPVRLANMYIKGDGVPQNCEQALVLLRSAAAKENAAADSRLGSMYANGTCVPRDRVRAYQYMSSAVEANPNAVWARDFREQLWANMTPQERSQAQKYR